MSEPTVRIQKIHRDTVKIRLIIFGTLAALLLIGTVSVVGVSAAEEKGAPSAYAAEPALYVHAVMNSADIMIGTCSHQQLCVNFTQRHSPGNQRSQKHYPFYMARAVQ